jgi:mannose-6-phosphate isomerase-like protein (cupin superfamily)
VFVNRAARVLSLSPEPALSLPKGDWCARRSRVAGWPRRAAFVLESVGLAVCVCGLAACARAPQRLSTEGRTVNETTVTALLAAHPLGDGENISAVGLGHTDVSSWHLVQIRDRERPHIHATHDLTVMLVRGHGQLHMAGTAYDLRAGDIAVVPHGTPHYFVNSAAAPAAAFVTFAPPYDGKDQVPVE